jgi:isocitrate dehydrogenase
VKKKVGRKTREGRIVLKADGTLHVPDRPIIPYVQGDGTGVDIWPAGQRVMDAAVEKAYGGRRSIQWLRVYAGQEAQDRFGTPLPESTLKALRTYRVGIKGPLTTPVGGGIRSVNVALRQVLDLYACVRPVYHVPGVPSPVRNPEQVNMVIFRENTEDVYAGIEWKKGSKEAKKVLRFLNEEMLAGSGTRIRADSGIGVKPVSLRATQRIVRMAIQHALRERCPSVTLVHKGNIMKYTEGAFRDWGYDLARKEFGSKVVFEEDLAKAGGKRKRAKLLVKDRIADAMFQQVLLRPDEYSVICTLNLNGAPRYAGQDKVNPSSLILSGVSMLEYMGWSEAGVMIQAALTRTVQRRTVTYDLERQMQAEGRKGVKLLRCSEFADAICKNMK